METTLQNIQNIMQGDEGCWLVTSGTIEPCDFPEGEVVEEITSFDDFSLVGDETLVGDTGVHFAISRDMADRGYTRDDVPVMFPFFIENAGQGYPFNIRVIKHKY